MADPAKKYTLIAPNGVEINMLLSEDHLKVLLGQGFTRKPEPKVRRAVVEEKLVTKAAEPEE